MECRGRFMNSKRELLIDVHVVHGQYYEQAQFFIYEQSILPVDDTLAEDLIVSCYTDANNSVADECQMNSDLKKKWTFISEGRDNFAMLKDWLFILIFP